jgi:hypothetical protein
VAGPGPHRGCPGKRKGQHCWHAAGADGKRRPPLSLTGIPLEIATLFLRSQAATVDAWQDSGVSLPPPTRSPPVI